MRERELEKFWRRDAENALIAALSGGRRPFASEWNWTESAFGLGLEWQRMIRVRV